MTARHGALALLLITLAIALWLVPIAPDWIEREYASTRYLTLQQIVTPVTNRVPIALFDLLIGSIVVLVIASGARRLFRAKRGRRWRALGRTALDAAVVAAILAIWFSLAWGANYRRAPLRERLDYDRARVTPAAALELTRTAVREMNRLHPIAHGAAWPTLDTLTLTLAGPFADVQRALGQRQGAAPARPKSTLLQPYFRWAAIDGMTDPFFLETLVNRDVLPIERPFVVAHEWSHLAGYAHEAEASFLGWLICQHADAQAQYSAWMAAYFHLAPSLAAADRRTIDATLQDGVRRDLRAVVERYQRSAPRVRVVAWRVYDNFLKANRVAEGIASYDGVVTLLLGTTFNPSWRPMLKTPVQSPHSPRP